MQLSPQTKSRIFQEFAMEDVLNNLRTNGYRVRNTESILARKSNIRVAQSKDSIVLIVPLADTEQREIDYKELQDRLAKTEPFKKIKTLLLRPYSEPTINVSNLDKIIEDYFNSATDKYLPELEHYNWIKVLSIEESSIEISPDNIVTAVQFTMLVNHVYEGSAEDYYVSCSAKLLLDHSMHILEVQDFAPDLDSIHEGGV